jgi:hypothetical protein
MGFLYELFRFSIDLIKPNLCLIRFLSIIKASQNK